MIEKIEYLRPELQIQSLVDGDSLEQRSVEVGQTWAAQRSARDVAEGTLSRDQEGPRIEVLIRTPQDNWSGEVRIPVGRIGLIGVARSGSVGARQRREGESAQNRDDPIQLPAADQLVHEPVGGISKLLPVPERQLIAEVRAELMLQAVGPHAPV